MTDSKNDGNDANGVIDLPNASAYDPRKLGRDVEATELVEFEGAAFSNNTARYHSVLAMEAARKMRRTRQKKKTGQEVCHHLRMMLATEPVGETDSPAEGQFKLAI